MSALEQAVRPGGRSPAEAMPAPSALEDGGLAYRNVHDAEDAAVIPAGGTCVAASRDETLRATRARYAAATRTSWDGGLSLHR